MQLQLSSCAKCGKEFKPYSTKHNSDESYYGLPSLNEKYPDNPYRGMSFCLDCYWEVIKNVRVRAQTEVETYARKAINLFVDEEIKEHTISKYDRSWSEKFEGILFLTTQRIIFVMHDYDFICKFKIGFRYEEIAAYEDKVDKKKGNCYLKINDQLGTSHLFKVGSEKELTFLLEKIKELTYKNNIRIGQEKIGKRVQVVLDFSSLKDVMSKGGIVMTAYKCPVCNGKLDIPEVGKVLICSYCGTPIKPVDIFEKIKSLIQ